MVVVRRGGAGEGGSLAVESPVRAAGLLSTEMPDHTCNTQSEANLRLIWIDIIVWFSRACNY